MLRPLAVAAGLSLIARADVPELIPELLKLSPRQESWDKIMNDRIAAGLPVPELPPEREVSLEAATAGDVLKVLRREGLLTPAWTPPVRPADAAESNQKDDKGPALTPEIRQTILQAVHAEPAAIPKVLPYLPADEAAATEINSLYHLLPGESSEQKEQQRSVRAWIFLHSGLQRGEVLADAWHADWRLYGRDARKDPSLHAVQARDPQAFTALLEMLATRGDPGLAVLAARLLLEQAKAGEGEQWRSQLMWAVVDPMTPRDARKMAVDALIFCYWPERDAWILSNLELADPGEISWYEKPVLDSRGHWIPALVKCVQQGNPFAKAHAVELLVALNQQEASPEILRALLPWLTDPAWTTAPDTSRLRLIQGFGKIAMPEAIPGLIHAFQTETEDVPIQSAADALAHQDAKAALPELRATLGKFKDSYHRRLLIKAINALGGYTTDEVIAGLEAYYASLKEDKSGSAAPAEQDLLVDVGSYFNETGKITAEKFGAAIKARIAAIEKDQPEVARRFLRLMLSSDEASSESVAKVLSDGSITIHELDVALQHRKSTGGTWKAEDFVPLTTASGATAGLAAVLTADSGRIATALKSEDSMTQAALIAAARRTGDALDLDRVMELMKSGSPRVVSAASAYLQNSQDEKAHRLWDSIRQPVDATRSPYKELEELKKILRERLGYPANPVEIIGLVVESGFRADDIYVVVYADSAVAVKSFGEGRFGTYPLTAESLDLVHDYLAKYQVDALPAYGLPGFDGVSCGYIHETAESLRSFMINDPPESRDKLEKMLADGTSKGVMIYYNLMGLLRDLAPSDGWNITYGPGIEIVIPEEVSNILDVWRTGDELQVTARDAIRTGRFRVDLKKKELGPAAPGSEDWSRPALVAKLPPDFTTDSGLSSWQDKQGGGAVFGGDLRERKGLWLMRKDAVPEFLAAGSFTDELVSPDGKWCVAAKPKGIVRINLETREVFPVDLAAADGLKAVAYLTPRKKFLIVRPVSVPVPGKDPETRQEYGLLDPVTGESEPLAGDYRAFPGYEAAQPAGTRDEMWGGVDADLADDGTLVGRLNGQTLLFQPVWQVKGLSLNAATIWVDEKREILYAAKNGDLLKIDLKGMKIPVAKK